MWVRNNKGNVFVGNLPPDFPDERLAETFDPFGIVLSASIARDPQTGKRLRYGFIDIATEKAARRAIEAMNGAELSGSRIEVSPSENSKGSKKTSARPAGRRNPARPRTGTAAGGDGGLARRPPPHRMATEDGEDGAAGFAPRALPRRQPSFQVERRPLPRRVQ